MVTLQPFGFFLAFVPSLNNSENESLNYFILLNHCYPKILSNCILVKLQLEINCHEILEPNVVLRLGNSVHWPCKQVFLYETERLAHLGTTWLPFNNSLILQKFDVLSFLLYLSHAKVLSNHIFGRSAPSDNFLCDA